MKRTEVDCDITEGGGHNTKTNKIINIDIDRLHHTLDRGGAE